MKESKTECENNPKNTAKTISTYVALRFGNTNKLMKNNGRKIINKFLFKNKKLRRAIKTAKIK